MPKPERDRTNAGPTQPAKEPTPAGANSPTAAHQTGHAQTRASQGRRKTEAKEQASRGAEENSRPNKPRSYPDAEQQRPKTSTAPAPTHATETVPTAQKKEQKKSAKKSELARRLSLQNAPKKPILRPSRKARPEHKPRQHPRQENTL